MSFSVSCDRCLRKFINTRSLAKHRLQSHSLQSEVLTSQFVDCDGNKASTLKARTLPRGERKKQYLKWLSCVTERMNGAHHPGFKGNKISVFDK